MPFELSDSSVQFAAVERVYRLKYHNNVKHSHFLCKVLNINAHGFYIDLEF